MLKNLGKTQRPTLKNLGKQRTTPKKAHQIRYHNKNKHQEGNHGDASTRQRNKAQHKAGHGETAVVKGDG
mgnify:CR=1 FL=1